MKESALYKYGKPTFSPLIKAQEFLGSECIYEVLVTSSLFSRLGNRVISDFLISLNKKEAFGSILFPAFAHSSV